MAPIRFAAYAALFAVLPLAAADPPKVLTPAGNEVAKLGQLTSKSITIKRKETELTGSKRPRVDQVENDYEYDLASDVLFRRQDLPRGTDGRAKAFSNDEYAKLREPLGAPGYKADRNDFKPGQIVKVFYGKESPRERAVVTTVLLLKDGPDAPKKDEKKKSDK